MATDLQPGWSTEGLEAQTYPQRGSGKNAPDPDSSVKSQELRNADPGRRSAEPGSWKQLMMMVLGLDVLNL